MDQITELKIKEAKLELEVEMRKIEAEFQKNIIQLNKGLNTLLIELKNQKEEINKLKEKLQTD